MFKSEGVDETISFQADTDLYGHCFTGQVKGGSCANPSDCGDHMECSQVFGVKTCSCTVGYVATLRGACSEYYNVSRLLFITYNRQNTQRSVFDLCIG